METNNLAIRSRRVVTPDGVRPATVFVVGEKIDRVEGSDVDAGDSTLIDVDDAVVMPGVIDAHVHINEPGRTHWEGFETATRAAAGGGVTTLVDMPLNCVPSTTDVPSLNEKLDAAAGKCHVDVGFWGGVVPGNTAELEPLRETGVLGFKCFMVPSGVDEFEWVRDVDLREALPILARLGTPLLCHAEDPDIIADASDAWDDADPCEYATYLASRPPEAEERAIRRIIALCEEFDAAMHVVHLSASGALDSLRRARASGLPLTVETCAHYLYFDADDVPHGATEYKCAPPIRSAENRERLWEALEAGDIDYVATDHSPSPPDLKELDSGRFDLAWGGIASLQLLLPTLWTAARGRGHDVDRLVEWLCEGPARRAGLADRKGRIAAGHDADLVVWDPSAEFTVDAETLQHRHPVTPYDGETLRGVVRSTYLRGNRIFHENEFSPAAGGTLLA